MTPDPSRPPSRIPHLLLGLALAVTSATVFAAASLAMGMHSAALVPTTLAAGAHFLFGYVVGARTK